MASSQSTKVEKRAQERKKGSNHTPRISTHRKSSASSSGGLASSGATAGQGRLAPQRHGLTRVVMLPPYRPQIEQILGEDTDMQVSSMPRIDHRQTEEARRLAREAKNLNFRLRQAKAAESSAAILALKKDSVAHMVALLVIKEFPLAEPYVKEDGTPVNRTAAAIKIALERLDDKDAAREKAVKYGVSAARVALRGAYDKVKDNSSELVNT